MNSWRACLIAQEAHKNDIDKIGEPYIDHVKSVVRGVAYDITDGYTTFDKYPIYIQDDYFVAAWLHDVIEDHPAYIEEYWDELNDNQKKALVLLKHEKNEKYSDYIENLKDNDIARVVKINDLIDNTEPDRLQWLDNGTVDRLLLKYTPALQTLRKAEYDRET